MFQYPSSRVILPDRYADALLVAEEERRFNTPVVG